MLLTISTTHQPATDLGYLLHKHPARVQTFKLAFGQGIVFYPEATEEKCTAALLLDIDPIKLVRGRSRSEFALAQYVNDRPYVASSFLSVAIAQIYGTALNGRCKDRPQLVEQPIPLEITLDVVPCRAGEGFLRALFEPLGYTVAVEGAPLDPAFPDWGDSGYFHVRLTHTVTLADLLSHLYVLIPVLDNDKHYYVGQHEIDKLLTKGEGWLPDHPQREVIALRYLKHRRSLQREALDRLTAEEPAASEEATVQDAEEARLEIPLSLHEQRLRAVLGRLKGSGAREVVDLGCGEGRLLRKLVQEKQFTRIVGVDVAIAALERAAERLNLARLPERERIELLHGALTYRDERLSGFDAAAVVEVIEHIEPARLPSFERALFEFARPRMIILTTPNREYNAVWETLPAGNMRHRDHRFEWDRAEFVSWATTMAGRYGYRVEIESIGPEDERYGAPSQMGVFIRDEGVEKNGD